MTRPDAQGMAFLCDMLREVTRREVMSHFRRIEARVKADGSVVTAADLAVQEAVAAGLEQRWPGIPLLGEEMSVAEQSEVAEGAESFWCLDPLDGTTNYSAGFPFFCVSLAYLSAGQVEAGVVYDPVRDECFSAVRNVGAWLNGDPLRLQGPVPAMERCILGVDVKRLPRRLRHAVVDAAPVRSQRNLGAAALEWCWLAAGRMQLYLHGGQKLWDYAAGHLVLAEAGGRACLLDRLEGRCGTVCGLAPRAVIAATEGGLFERWRGWVRAHR